MKKNEKQESSEKQEKNEKELKLTELQKDGDANSSSRKLITDAYKAFAIDNQDALASKRGVRAGKLKVWIEVKRTLRAAIID